MKKQFENPGSEGSQIVSSTQVDINMVALTCKKFNQIMSSVSLVSMISADQVREWNQYIMLKVFGLLQERSVVEKMTEE